MAMKKVGILITLTAATLSPVGANRTVRVPLTLVSGSNSLYANILVGTPPTQLITPTVYSDTYAITITASSFK